MHAKEVKRSVDLKRAFHWYEGCEVTQFNLGSFNEFRRYVDKDENQTFEFHQNRQRMDV